MKPFFAGKKAFMEKCGPSPLDNKAQSSFEVLLLLAVLIFIALVVGLYLKSLATARPSFTK